VKLSVDEAICIRLNPTVARIALKIIEIWCPSCRTGSFSTACLLNDYVSDAGSFNSSCLLNDYGSDAGPFSTACLLNDYISDVKLSVDEAICILLNPTVARIALKIIKISIKNYRKLH
jgi:hypothetical protein